MPAWAVAAAAAVDVDATGVNEAGATGEVDDVVVLFGDTDRRSGATLAGDAAADEGAGDDRSPAPGEPLPVFGPTLLRNIRLMLDTLGTLNLSQTPSLTRRSLISHANMPGSLDLSLRMNETTCGRVSDGCVSAYAHMCIYL